MATASPGLTPCQRGRIRGAGSQGMRDEQKQVRRREGGWLKVVRQDERCHGRGASNSARPAAPDAVQLDTNQTTTVLFSLGSSCPARQSLSHP